MSTNPLDQLAGRVSANPRFLADALDRAQLDLGLSDLGLARRVGCAVEVLTSACADCRGVGARWHRSLAASAATCRR